MNDIKFGSGYFMLDGMKLSGEFTSTSIEEPVKDILGESTSHIIRPTDVSFEAEVSYINWDLIRECSELNSTNLYTVAYNKPVIIQARKHKKKRINKKWLKRYGYKTMFKKVYIDNVSIIHEGENSFSLVKRNLKPVPNWGTITETGEGAWVN